LTPSCPDADAPPSDRRPRLSLDQGPPNRRSVASAKSRVPLRRKRPAGTQGDGDIDEPSVVTGRARGLDHHAASEIDAPGPCLTPTCGGRTRRPRTEEWPLPDDHPRSQHQLGALDPRRPITEEGLTTVPLPPPRRPVGNIPFSAPDQWSKPRRMRPFPANCPNRGARPEGPVRAVFRLSGFTFSEATEPRPFWYGCWKFDNSMSWRTPDGERV
jgi:hypothetical protein